MTCEFSSAVAAERLDVPQAQIGIHQSSLTDAADWLIALAAGVPLALIPLFVDGPANARRVAEIGAGIELAGTSGLADAVERLVGYPRYREAAGRVAAEIRTLPPVDGAVDDIVATARRRELAA
jgi:hypothetical protein